MEVKTKTKTKEVFQILCFVSYYRFLSLNCSSLLLKLLSASRLLKIVVFSRHEQCLDNRTSVRKKLYVAKMRISFTAAGESCS